MDKVQKYNSFNTSLKPFNLQGLPISSCCPGKFQDAKLVALQVNYGALR
jgi:hypothetical protein